MSYGFLNKRIAHNHYYHLVLHYISSKRFGSLVPIRRIFAAVLFMVDLFVLSRMENYR